MKVLPKGKISDLKLLPKGSKCRHYLRHHRKYHQYYLDLRPLGLSWEYVRSYPGREENKQRMRKIGGHWEISLAMSQISWKVETTLTDF